MVLLGFEFKENPSPVNVSIGMPRLRCFHRWLAGKKSSSSRAQPEEEIAKKSFEEALDRPRESQTQINNFQDSIIHQLPPEIASHIFELCVQAPDQWPYERSGRLTKGEVSAPLTLGSVCRTWRWIAWTTPQLWTFISVSLSSASSAKLRRRCEIVKEWLGRSGQLPLSIQILAPAVNSHSNVTDFEPLIEFINQLSSRWKALDLQVPSYYIFRFCGDSGGAMALQNLRLHNLSSSHANFRLKNGKARPSHVLLSGLPSKTVHIEWSHVTHICLGQWLVLSDLEHCLELFQCASRLISCILKFVIPTSSQFEMPNKPLIHDQLQELDISVANDCSVSLSSQLFNSFTFPVLENLHCCLGGTMPADSLISLLDRSSCPLHTLSISYTGRSRNDPEVLRLLKASTSIQHLYLGFVSGDTYQQITRLLASNTASINHGDSDPFLPALESLKYISDSTEPISWEYQPDIFGPLAQIHSADRRPLKKHEVWFLSWTSFEGVHEYIDRESVVRFLKLTQNGIILDFKLFTTSLQEYNFLELSMVYHGLAKDQRRCMLR